MINISNPTSKDNSTWLPWAPAGPDQPTGTSGLADLGGAASGRRAAGRRAAGRQGAGRQDAGRRGAGLSAVGAALRIMLSWLAAFPARLGDRLFAANDTEAYWHDWQVTKTHGGLGRSYRDPRFGLLAECPKCRGAGGTAKLPCPPCHGTGRITREGAPI